MSGTSKLFCAALVFCLYLPSSWAADQHSVKGVVTAVKLSVGKVTISHGPITELGMSAMTMDFKVHDPAMLEEVNKGHEVAFVLEKKQGGNLVIMEIEDLGLAKATQTSSDHQHSH